MECFSPNSTMEPNQPKVFSPDSTDDAVLKCEFPKNNLQPEINPFEASFATADLSQQTKSAPTISTATTTQFSQSFSKCIPIPFDLDLCNSFPKITPKVPFPPYPSVSPFPSCTSEATTIVSPVTGEDDAKDWNSLKPKDYLKLSPNPNTLQEAPLPQQGPPYSLPNSDFMLTPRTLGIMNAYKQEELALSSCDSADSTTLKTPSLNKDSFDMQLINKLNPSTSFPNSSTPIKTLCEPIRCSNPQKQTLIVLNSGKRRKFHEDIPEDIKSISTCLQNMKNMGKNTLKEGKEFKKKKEGGNKEIDLEEKRKNFLERNRQAALKCREKKKRWLTELQNQVQFLGDENEALQNQSTSLKEEIFHLKSLLLAHKDCRTAQENGVAGLDFVRPVQQYSASMQNLNFQPCSVGGPALSQRQTFPTVRGGGYSQWNMDGYVLPSLNVASSDTVSETGIRVLPTTQNGVPVSYATELKPRHPSSQEVYERAPPNSFTSASTEPKVGVTSPKAQQMFSDIWYQKM